ncbi:MAG: hypothetical protein ACJATA_001771 [Sphingobacteriales bacterium]|jgi:hypothetical protein
MKKILFPILIIVATVFTACEKAENLFRFNIPVTSEFTIPKTSFLPPGFQTIPVEQEVNTSDEFSSQGTSIDKVKEIKLDQADLEIINPSGKSFGFLSEIEVFMSMEDGSQKIKVAHNNNIPENNGSIVSLVTTSDELDKYLKAEKFKLDFNYKIRQTTTQDITIEVQQKYNVKANL